MTDTDPSLIAALREHLESPRKAGRIPTDFDDAVAQFRDCIGASGPRPKLKRHALPKSRKMAIFSDPHCPFHDLDTIAAFFKATAGADVCVMGGDLFDFYSVSRFTKYENVPMTAELAAGTWLVEECAKRYPNVMVIGGNHDARLEREIAAKNGPDVVEALRAMSKTGTLNAVEGVCASYPNVEYLSRKVDRFAVDWHAQIGDVIVSHAEKFSKVPGSALRAVRDGFYEFADQYAIAQGTWKVLLQAHTHQLAHLYIGGGMQLVEIGCACRLHGYQVSARMNGASQKQGWATLEQRDGQTVPESVRLTPYSYMRPR